MKGYIRGQILVCLLLSIIYGFSLALVGLKYGFSLGILTGLFTLIPYVGVSLGFLSAILIALATKSGIAFVFIIIGIFLVIHALESFYLTPSLVGNRVGLNPLETIIMLIVFGNYLGFFGLIIAIPMGATFKLFTIKLFNYYTIVREKAIKA